MKRTLFLIIGLTVMLAGCWDANVLQDVNYVASVGIDYKEGSYYAYAMLLDFSNVAKQDGAGREDAPVWVGRGKGSTVGEAFRDLYATSQQHMFWGHVVSIVFSESMLRRGVESDFIDTFIRFRELRFTQWVFAAKLPIDELFAARPFFNLSPLSSILAEPSAVYRQDSYIRPLRLQRLMVDIREPGRTALLPCLAVNTAEWKKDGKDDPKLYVDGVVAVTGKRETAWLARDKLSGLRWFDRQARNIALTVQTGETKSQARVLFGHPKTSAKVRMAGGVLVLDLQLDVTGRIVELSEHTDADMDAITRSAERQIRQQITDTFEHAAAQDVDIYHMEHRLYHDHYPVWAKETKLGKTQPPRRLGSVRVHVRIGNGGMYKVKKMQEDY